MSDLGEFKRRIDEAVQARQAARARPAPLPSAEELRQQAKHKAEEIERKAENRRLRAERAHELRTERARTIQAGHYAARVLRGANAIPNTRLDITRPGGFGFRRHIKGWLLKEETTETSGYNGEGTIPLYQGTMLSKAGEIIGFYTCFKHYKQGMLVYDDAKVGRYSMDDAEALIDRNTTPGGEGLELDEQWILDALIRTVQSHNK